MRTFLILVLGLSGTGLIQAQSVEPVVVATAGEHAVNANAQLSWTLGEVVIDSYTGGTFQLTQGFHQTNLVIIDVDNPVADFPVRVYPNPTSGWVNIEVDASAPAVSVEVFDAHGQLVMSHAADQQQEFYLLDLSDFAPGIYLLKLRNQNTKSMQSFKIIKHN